MARSYQHDLTPFIQSLRERLPRHEIEPGRFRRHLHSGDTAAADAYGTADYANLLYTIGELPSAPERRAELVAGIRSFQNEETGVFVDDTHSDTHTTAHCVAALELFDERPTHPLRYLRPLVHDAGALERYLDALDWETPWQTSHDGAGIFAALVLAGEADDSFTDRYFQWFDREVSPETGLWRVGRLRPLAEKPGLFGNLAGSFHYHFNYSWARWAMPHPDKVIDSCLLLLAESPVDIAVDSVEFKDIDWIFCINRALRQSGHRRAEVQEALQRVCDRVVAALSDADYLASDQFDDLHTIFGGLCAVAELQAALPNSIHTGSPLRLVLDRRPFI